MTKEQYLAIASKKYDEVKRVSEQTTLYDIEKGVVELIRGLGSDLMQGMVGTVPNDKRKKKH